MVRELLEYIFYKIDARQMHMTSNDLNVFIFSDGTYRLSYNVACERILIERGDVTHLLLDYNYLKNNNEVNTSISCNTYLKLRDKLHEILDDHDYDTQRLNDIETYMLLNDETGEINLDFLPYIPFKKNM